MAVFKAKNGEPADMSFGDDENYRAEILIAKMYLKEVKGKTDVFLFKQEYYPESARIKDPYLRAECFYHIFVITKDKIYADYAFEIMRGLKNKREANARILKIVNIALQNDNFEEFIRFLNLSRKNILETDLEAFKVLKSERFCNLVSASKNKYKLFHYYPVLFSSLNYLKKGDTQSLENRVFLPYLHHITFLDFYKESTYPIIAYVAHLKGYKEVYEEFKGRSISSGTLAGIRRCQSKYLRFAALVFAECGDWQTAMLLASKSESAFSELKILDAVLDHYSSDRAAVEAICGRINFLTSAREKFRRAY